MLLIDAYSCALNLADKSVFDSEIKKARTVKLQHDVLKDWYERKLKAKLRADGKSADWISSLENALLFVFAYLRDARNGAGHPTGVALGRDVVLSHLVVFPSYVRVLYDLIQWLDAKKPV